MSNKTARSRVKITMRSYDKAGSILRTSWRGFIPKEYMIRIEYLNGSKVESVIQDSVGPVHNMAINGPTSTIYCFTKTMLETRFDSTKALYQKTNMKKRTVLRVDPYKKYQIYTKVIRHKNYGDGRVDCINMEYLNGSNEPYASLKDWLDFFNNRKQ